MIINAENMHFKVLNESIKSAPEQDIIVENCIGQRYIGDGVSDKRIRVNGTAGNALGAYLNGAEIRVFGNAQDAIGDTMNDGEIFVYGSCGDAPGYAMRGGKIFIREHAGYRAGIHMKAYETKHPVLVIGGKAGSFLGEYQAGGVIVVLGIGCGQGESPVGNFCGTGMHGGKMFIRCEQPPAGLPKQVTARKAEPADMEEIEAVLKEFCCAFEFESSDILSRSFYVLEPDTKNPYKQLYTYN